MTTIGVAVLDSGIYRHIDFGRRIIGFIDFVNNRTYAYDDNGHGTHVCGIIGGNGEASSGKYRGIARNCNLIALKVLDKNGNGKIENVIKAINWIMVNKERFNIRVANISFGMTEEVDRPEQEELIGKIEELWNCGVVVVTAAGNDGPKSGTITAPGCSQKVITVGAIESDRFFPSRGPTSRCIVKPEVVTAGTNIIACSNRKNMYSIKSGTSMSAPIVSGAVAAYLNMHKEATPKEIKMKIRECCIPGDFRKWGWGRLDMNKMLKN